MLGLIDKFSRFCEILPIPLGQLQKCRTEGKKILLLVYLFIYSVTYLFSIPTK